MNVTEETIAGLDSLLKESVETDVVQAIAVRLGVTAQQALAIYFASAVPAMIDSGDLGVQYLSPEYLAEEVLRNQSC